MNAEHSRELFHPQPPHILLLGTQEDARMLRPQLRGGHFKITHLHHLGTGTSALTVRLIQPDVWLACCAHSQDIEQIRQITPRTPLVICSSYEEEAHIVSMLDAGADDYVSFSCGKQELQARLHGHTRRYRESLASSCGTSRQIKPFPVLESEDQYIRLHREERCVVVRGKTTHLTPIECALLHILMSQGSKVISHQSLLQAVWGEGYHGEVDYIRVYLHTLRLKLGDDPRHPSYLETITGVGYRFRQACRPAAFQIEASP